MRFAEPCTVKLAEMLVVASEVVLVAERVPTVSVPTVEFASVAVLVATMFPKTPEPPLYELAATLEVSEIFFPVPVTNVRFVVDALGRELVAVVDVEINAPALNDTPLDEVASVRSTIQVPSSGPQLGFNV